MYFTCFWVLLEWIVVQFIQIVSVDAISTTD